MNDTSKTVNGQNGLTPANSDSKGTGEAGRTILIGLLGGIASAAGYAVYNRLPEEQKARLQQQVRSLVESRLAEIRSNFNI